MHHINQTNFASLNVLASCILIKRFGRFKGGSASTTSTRLKLTLGHLMWMQHKSKLAQVKSLSANVFFTSL